MNDNDIFDLVRKNYATANADYIQRQIAMASAYLTDEQKSELWNKGHFNSLSEKGSGAIVS